MWALPQRNFPIFSQCLTDRSKIMKIYDFAAGFPAIDLGNAFFESRLRIECAGRGMEYILIDRITLDNLATRIKEGTFKVRVYLDMASETFVPGDAYLDLAYFLKSSGAKIVDDPDDVKIAADKSITHFKLIAEGVSVPYTIIMKSGQEHREFNDEERAKMGGLFVVKPALGYGQRGVRFTTYESIDMAVAESRCANMGYTLLFQEFIEPKEIEGCPAWFRVFSTFGEVIPCWWNPSDHTYREVNMWEMYRHKLLPIIQITKEIARITRIDWFSTEIAINKRNNEFLVIDYMNDQCWVNPKSKSSDGIPDDILNRIAFRIVEKAHYYITHFSALFRRTNQIS